VFRLDVYIWTFQNKDNALELAPQAGSYRVMNFLGEVRYPFANFSPLVYSILIGNLTEKRTVAFILVLYIIFFDLVFLGFLNSTIVIRRFDKKPGKIIQGNPFTGRLV
jgi:hypothetical protein